MAECQHFPRYLSERPTVLDVGVYISTNKLLGAVFYNNISNMKGDELLPSWVKLELGPPVLGAATPRYLL
jgi:hypothetical protein